MRFAESDFRNRMQDLWNCIRCGCYRPAQVTASHARIIDDGQAYVIDHHITDVTYSPHRKLGKAR